MSSVRRTALSNPCLRIAWAVVSLRYGLTVISPIAVSVWVNMLSGTSSPSATVVVSRVPVTVYCLSAVPAASVSSEPMPRSVPSWSTDWSKLAMNSWSSA